MAGKAQKQFTEGSFGSKVALELWLLRHRQTVLDVIGLLQSFSSSRKRRGG